MKREITVKQVGTRVYLRSVDMKSLRPILNIAGIELRYVDNFRSLHTPKYYIDANELFKFLQTARQSFIIKII